MLNGKLSDFKVELLQKLVQKICRSVLVREKELRRFEQVLAEVYLRILEQVLFSYILRAKLFEQRF